MLQSQIPSDTQHQGCPTLSPGLRCYQSHMGKLLWLRVVVQLRQSSRRLDLPEQLQRQKGTVL